jgi:NTE family protein
VVLAAVQDALDWDARQAEVILGTSGGAEIAAALGAGIAARTLVDALVETGEPHPVLSAHLAHDPGRFPPRPAAALPNLGLARAGLVRRSAHLAAAGVLPRGRGDASWLRDYGAALASEQGWVAHPQTWLVAADTATGARVRFGAQGAPPVRLQDALAASWAIPGWFPPVPIAGRHYVDGGAVSSVSADLLAPMNLDEVIVIAPMTSQWGAPGRGAARIERALRTRMTRGLNEEIRALRASGARVIRIEPTAQDLAAMGPNFMDISRRRATLETAARNAPGVVAAAIRASSDAATVAEVTR